MTRKELDAVLRPLVLELRRIGDLIETAIAWSMHEPAPDPTPKGCPHPEDDRVSLGMTNGQEEWECRKCRYRTPIVP